MKLKKTLKVFVGIPNLANDDRYNGYRLRVIDALNHQQTSVEILKPYITPPHAGKFEHGNTNRLDAIIGRMNNILTKFNTVDATHLWILDGDVEAPPHALDTLIRHNVDVASGVYPQHDFKTSNKLVFGEMKENHRCGGFTPSLWSDVKGGVFGENERWSGGSGCMLIKRRVFKRAHPKLTALKFTRKGPQGICGGDMLFWKNIQDAGFTVRVDTNVVCGHLPNHRLENIKEWLPQ